MLTPEGKVKYQIKKILVEYNVYYFMPVQNGMGSPALDFHCAIPPTGKALFIEAKAPGKKATPRQLLTIEQQEASGALVLVMDGSNYDALILLLEAEGAQPWKMM